MKKLLSTLLILGAIHTNEIASQDVEEIIVVTSALIDTTEITNPLYVIDGDEIIDDATTSLGDAIDSYLGELQIMVQLLDSQLLEACQDLE